MRNKIIPIFMIFFLLSQSLYAGNIEKNIQSAFDVTTTSGGKWTDDNTGLTYTSFGKRTFSFNKLQSSYTPWFKGTPPTLKAGCGGVSLDGGFVAFLDLEEIGKQLETAISSVGMGVIVALLQTLPSIGKAFENVQKLVRKIQSMLQNACQLTVTALNNHGNLGKVKKAWQEDTDAWIANNAISKAFQGAATWLDDFEKLVNCPGDDTKCKENAMSKLFGTATNDSEPRKSEKNIYLIDRDAGNRLNNVVGDNSGIFTDSFENFIMKGKFKGQSLGLSQTYLTLAQLKVALFGVLVIPEAASVLPLLKTNGEISEEVIKSLIGNEKTSHDLSLIWKKPENSIKDIGKFLIGSGDDINTTTTKTLKIPLNLKVVVAKHCENATKDAGCKSSRISTIYFVENAETNSSAYEEIEWEGIYKQTYKTILSKISTKNPRVSNPFGLFIPGGQKYLSLIKENSDNYNSAETLYYADTLAKVNVVYALKSIIGELKLHAMNISSYSNEKNRNNIKDYLAKVAEIVKQLEKEIIDFPGDVVFLDHLQNIFNQLEKDNRRNRARGSK